jgi:cardiolipin synthase A/B
MSSTEALIATLAYLLSIAICIVALFVVPVNRKPSSATAWLMPIFGLPYLGALLFFMFGSPKLSRRRRAQQRTMDDLLRKTVAEARQRPELQAVFDAPILPRYTPFVQLNTNLGGLPAFAGP